MIPAFKFVLVFMAMILSQQDEARRVPIASAPRSFVRRLPGSFCTEWGWRLAPHLWNLRSYSRMLLAIIRSDSQANQMDSGQRSLHAQVM